MLSNTSFWNDNSFQLTGNCCKILQYRVSQLTWEFNHDFYVYRLYSMHDYVENIIMKYPSKTFNTEDCQSQVFQNVVYHFLPSKLTEVLGKELSLSRKLLFSNPNISATQCHRPQIFQITNFVRSINLSLKYQRFTRSGCEDTGIRKFEFVAKTQFLCPDSS